MIKWFQAESVENDGNGRLPYAATRKGKAGTRGLPKAKQLLSSRLKPTAFGLSLKQRVLGGEISIEQADAELCAHYMACCFPRSRVVLPTRSVLLPWHGTFSYNRGDYRTQAELNKFEADAVLLASAGLKSHSIAGPLDTRRLQETHRPSLAMCTHGPANSAKTSA